MGYSRCKFHATYKGPQSICGVMTSSSRRILTFCSLLLLFKHQESFKLVNSIKIEKCRSEGFQRLSHLKGHPLIEVNEYVINVPKRLTLFRDKLDRQLLRFLTIFNKCRVLLRKAVSVRCALLLFILSLGKPLPSVAASGSQFSGSSFSVKSSTRSSNRRESSTMSSTRHITTMRQTQSGRGYDQQRSTSTILPVHSSAHVSNIPPAIVGISILTAFVALPWLTILTKAKLGMSSAAVYEVQMAFRMSKSELQLFLNSINSALNSDQDKQLVTRIDELCVALLRRGDSLIGGGMVEYRDVPSKVDSMKELFNSVSVKERLKFDEEDSKSTKFIGTPLTSPGSNTELELSSSLMILTFALLSVGPVMRNRGLNVASTIPSILQYRSPLSFPASNIMAPHEAIRRKKLLQPQHLERFLYALPLYLRSLDKLQLRHEREEEDSFNDGFAQKYGYDISVVWTPNTAAEELLESDLLIKWPSVQLF